MRTTTILALLGGAGVLILLAGMVGAGGWLEAQPRLSRAQCDRLSQQGNHKEAYEGYRVLALDPKDEPALVGRDLTLAITCLQTLGRVDEIDAFREAVIAVHRDNWRLLQAAAESYLGGPLHYGFVVAGTFHRGNLQGGGRFVNAAQRDRVRALQLLLQGLDRARADADRQAAGRYLFALTGAVLADRENGEAWRLQTLTPLENLPDFDEAEESFWGGAGRRTRAGGWHAGLLPRSPRLGGCAE